MLAYLISQFKLDDLLLSPQGIVLKYKNGKLILPNSEEARFSYQELTVHGWKLLRPSPQIPDKLQYTFNNITYADVSPSA